jgi:hypothetical protein
MTGFLTNTFFFRYPLYEFTSFEFTNVGLTGATGPTRTQCLASYNTVTYPWLSNTAFFNVTTTGIQTWTSPATGLYQIECYGAQGSTMNDPGGFGGYSKGNILLTEGQTINIIVGQTTTVNDGGWGGGGNAGTGGSGGGGGGGASDVRIGGSALANRIIVAGGGGGSAKYNVTHDVFPGAGGGTTGTGGDTGNNGAGNCTAGGGGTQSAGGAAGFGNFSGTVGTLGVGGNSDSTLNQAGGGGGGYYGGGGGGSQSAGANFASGGGGGSGYIGGVTSGTMDTGVRSGSGSVIITRI